MNYARHHAWWGYIQAILRKYRVVRNEKDLHGIDAREASAVRTAIEKTSTILADGQSRVQLIDALYWRRTLTMDGAALEQHVSYRTALRWHGDFIKLVAYEMGLADKPPHDSLK